MRFERTKPTPAELETEAAPVWSVLPLGAVLHGTNELASLVTALERSIQEIVPRFTLTLSQDKAVRLKDYKEGWDYTNIVFGLSWADENGPIYDLPVHAGCMLLDERGTELMTIGLGRKESTDGAVVHMQTQELRQQEARLRAANAVGAAAKRGEAHDDDESGGDSYSRSGDVSALGGNDDDLGGLANDPDVEKLAVDLPKLSDAVKALVIVVGSYEPDAPLQGLDVTLRIVDQTRSLADGKPESPGAGFEAARYSVQVEDGRTSVVLAIATRDELTRKWRVLPVQQYYDGASFNDVLVDIETNYRATVPKPALTLPTVVATSVPRALYDLRSFADSPVERTLAIIKPDAVASTGAIVRDLTQHGFVVQRRARVQLTLPQAAHFYREHRAKPFFNGLVDFMTSAPCEVLVLSRAGAIGAWRALIVNRLRVLYGTNATRNALHGSDSAAAAASEIRFFFPDLVLGVPTPARGLEMLESSVNATLLKGLTALAKAKPADPLRWLAHWLLSNNPNKPKVTEPGARA